MAMGVPNVNRSWLNDGFLVVVSLPDGGQLVTYTKTTTTTTTSLCFGEEVKNKTCFKTYIQGVVRKVKIHRVLKIRIWMGCRTKH
uniref:Uncharacterized protein n=1 Tax=Octopus bimaculoides TaxID=37653 RepID=A0A0L8FPA4_OCTBM